MSVLSLYFSPVIVQASPIEVDYDRVVKRDEKGHEVVVYQKTDYPSIQESHGTAEDWKLENLLAAGIDPKFGIRTGLCTRLEGCNAVDEYAAAADAILSEKSESVES